ncbi:family 5 extracellular solute-binding protein [Mycolicibacterium mageritense DSM 44476 = CIP 104973]|uniref:ABC transporter substrate-binding protein n=2 Tax=Mycolicibacterium mageritense TaxID=53462 RepID=A0AAI8TYI8_MYCME|nr:ABC transporter substrate-binding protein [Mycolicibacterium mageritense]BDY30862.1 Oligopeptide-binding protein AppA [Mycolicibacterium mageritense]CDO24149.1 extracellular solute-binding protein [Mycolicibacterium mageritense DSM 44476 = CIP 104973]
MHMMDRRSFLRNSAVVAAALGGAAALAGCAPETATHTVLRVGSTTDIDSLNPFTAFSTQSYDVFQLLYDKLMEYDADLNIKPSLATEVRVDDGGKTYTYTLRDDVKWQDGSPFSADDVVFTLLMVRDNDYGTYGAYFTDLVDATATGNQVRLTYSQPQTLDPGVITPIVPKHVWAGVAKDDLPRFANDKPVGTGPFIFDSWQKGSVVTVTRNDSWWGPKPAAEKVTWTKFGSDDIVTQALRTGDIDIVAEIPPTIFAGLKDAANVKTDDLESFSFHMIGFNCSTDPKSKGNRILLDQAVRQALSCAVDRGQFVELALSGYGEPGTGLLPVAFGDFHYTPALGDVLDNDQEKARRLLEAAGYTDRNGDGIRETKDGVPLNFRILAIADTAVDVKAAELFVTAAKAIGIGLKLSTTDADAMGSTVFNTEGPDWDIMVWGWDSEMYDPSYLLGIATTDQIGGNNDTYWSNPRYDELYTQQRTTVDRGERVKLVQEMQAIHYASCPYIVMWYQKKLTGTRTDTWTSWQPIKGGMVLNFPRVNYLDVKPA